MAENNYEDMRTGLPEPEPGSSQLPSHIQAQLASAGGVTDTAGQPWAGRNLGEGTSHTHRFPADTGETSAAVDEACAQFLAGDIGEEDLVGVLAGSRVFAPVVAEVSHAVITEEGLVTDKESDMALISMTAPDGRRALPLFTDVESLTNWHKKARPVAAEMRRAALAAVEDGNQLIVVNPGQNLTFVLRRPAVWAVARGQRWIPSYKDPRVSEELERLAAGIPEVVDLRAEAGQGVATVNGEGQRLTGGGPGPELKITVRLVPHLSRQQLDTTIEVFQRALAASTLVSERVDSVQLALETAG